MRNLRFAVGFGLACLLLVTGCQSGLAPNEYAITRFSVSNKKPTQTERVTVYAEAWDPFLYTDETPRYKFSVTGGELVDISHEPPLTGQSISTFSQQVNWVVPDTVGVYTIRVQYGDASRSLAVKVLKYEGGIDTGD